MGVDFVYVRCPARLLEVARRDEAYAKRLIHGYAADLRAGETIEDIDVSRRENALLRVLSGDPAAIVGVVDPQTCAPARALEGLLWLHPGLDTGYGTAKFLRPEAVAAVAAELLAVTDAAFAERAAAMPRRGALGVDPDDAYLVPIFAALRAFYGRAAAAGQAVIVTPT